jgi:hypothetical protein
VTGAVARPLARPTYATSRGVKSLNALGIVLMACAACAPEPAPVTAAASPAAPSSSPSAAAAPPASSAPAAPPTPATVSDVLATNRAALDACYAKARAASPNLGRTSVEMTFVIDPEGKPKTVDLKYKHRMEDRAKECLRDAALSLHFPASLQGSQTGTIVFAPPAQ